MPARARTRSVGAAALAASFACAAAPIAAAPTVAPHAPPALAASSATAVVMPVIDACPKELNVKQTVTADIAGWTSINPQESYPFARIAFYAGPPADERRVVPSFENRTASGLHDGWMLRRQPAGYWVQCQYANTAAVVIRKLDDANNFCVADYDPRFATLIVKHWACMPGRPPGTGTRPASSRPRPASSGVRGP